MIVHVGCLMGVERVFTGFKRMKRQAKLYSLTDLMF